MPAVIGEAALPEPAVPRSTGSHSGAIASDIGSHQLSLHTGTQADYDQTSLQSLVTRMLAVSHLSMVPLPHGFLYGFGTC